MTVNGFRLPNAYVELYEAIQRGEAPHMLELQGGMDAYGHPWTSFGLNLFTDQDVIAMQTRDMARKFREQGLLGHVAEARNEPGFIHDFDGVVNFLKFGKSNTGEPYCFDFGGDSAEPSVVTWSGSDFYWRRVAPNFEAFMALFAEDFPQDPPDDEEWEESTPSPAALLGIHVKADVRQENEKYRILFMILVDEYAEITPAERLAVEAQVRRELEAEGMTDTQRERLNDIWARLHATDQA